MVKLHSYLQGLEFSSFGYWFLRSNVREFAVYNIASGDAVGTIETSSVAPIFIPSPALSNSEETRIAINTDILKDFEKYMHRPEYLVGCSKVDMYDFSYDEQLQDIYELMLIGCAMIRYNYNMSVNDPNYNPDTHQSSAHAAIEWLRKTDFFTAPASTRFHESYTGGLISHTLKVVDKLVELHQIPTFYPIVNLHSAILTALVHDWCKIGLYEPYMRNVKENGNWIQKQEYKIRDTSLTSFGHGVSSMFLAQRFFRLSVEEGLAIRWHMGHWRVTESEINELQQSNETYPLVHLLQFADQLSIVKY